jgi:hypothetical protein
MRAKQTKKTKAKYHITSPYIPVNAISHGGWRESPPYEKPPINRLKPRLPKTWPQQG